MACVQVQCLIPPCPEICDGEIRSPYSENVLSPPVLAPVNSNPLLPSRSIDPRLLMTPPLDINQTRYQPAYPQPQPDFRIDTSELDWWRLVLLAIGIVIGAVVIRKL